MSSNSRSLELLSRRISELDEVPPWWRASEARKVWGDDRRVCVWITHFVQVMSRYTEPFMDYEAGSGAVIDPDMADAMTVKSRLLSDISGCEPSLNMGPMQSHRQHWTRTARNAVASGEIQTLHQDAFIIPSVASHQMLDVKPSGLGLYTSTATSIGCSMWRTLIGPDSSMMWPQPWYTWEVDVGRDVRVAEIISATRWVELVCNYPRFNHGLVYPDWARVARDFDAIHVTLPTVVAAHGFHFACPDRGVIPPAFWDVETVLWLKWCFSGASLVESVGAG